MFRRLSFRSFRSHAKEMKTRGSFEGVDDTAGRMARTTPRYQNVTMTAKMVAVALSAAATLYGLRRAYFYFFTDVDKLSITAAVRDGLRMRPDWAVTLTYCAVHHVLSTEPGKSSKMATPYGAPLRIPARLEPEVKEILELLEHIRSENPMMSLADLWVLATSHAVAAVGGPSARTMLWGRQREADEYKGLDEHNEVTKAAPFIQQLASETRRQKEEEEKMKQAVVQPAYEVVESLVDPYVRDVRALKRHLAGHHFNTEEIVALMGYRSIGYHGEPYASHLKKKLQEAADAAPLLKSFPASDSSSEVVTMASANAGLFDNGIFQSLCAGGWAADLETEKGYSAWVSREESRRRAKGTGTSVSVESSSAPWWKFWAAKETQASSSSRSKAAPPVVARRWTLDPDAVSSDDTDPKTVTPTLASTGVPNVRLEAVDLCLMDDALLRGWVSKYQDNEMHFFTAFDTALNKVVNMGWAVNELSE